MGSDPDGQIWGQLILIVILTLINAGFAAAEIAVVSSSRTRMKAQADKGCLLYTFPSPRDGLLYRMPSSA